MCCAFVGSGAQRRSLITALQTLLNDVNEEDISGSFQKFYSLEYLGETYSSVNVNNGRNCHIVVNYWVGQDGNIDQTNSTDHPGEILYFMKIFLPVNQSTKCIILAFVNWFQAHPARNVYKTDHASVWCKSLFEIEGPASFIPVQKIKHKFISGFAKHQGEVVRVVMPKIPKYFW